MISKEKFIEYMIAIKKAEDKEREFGKALRALNSDNEGDALIYSDEIITMTKMLCDLMDIEYNKEDFYGDDIQYFMYECDWGNRDMEIEETDGTKIILKSIEDLYDYIKKHK